MTVAIVTGKDARLAARQNIHTTTTSGLAPGRLQANLIILPSRYADDFRSLCARNPVPCPLIAESSAPGRHDAVKSHMAGLTGRHLIGDDCDLRTDAPRYMVYRDAHLVKDGCYDVAAEWTADHVGFLVGCSYSFEAELAAAGLTPRHIQLGRNVPMYRTTMPLCPAGVFAGATTVVSMRPYRRCDVARVRRLTGRYPATHGEPLAWGWDALTLLGIRDIGLPDWGDAPLTLDGLPFGLHRGRGGDEEEGEEEEEEEEEVPVFWGCGVTPQEAVMRAGLEGTIMAHAPGHMLVLDAMDADITGKN